MKVLENIRKSTIVLLLVTIIVLIFLLKDFMLEIASTILSANIFYLLIAIIFYFLYVFLKAYIIYKSVNEKEKLTLREAFKHNIITQFFNGITPFSTGGQPMEVYLLTEHDIRASKATSVTIQNFIFYQTALVIYGGIAVACNYAFHLFPSVRVLKHAVLIGFLINTLIAIFLYIIMLSKKITSKMSKIMIKLLAKIKIIKNKEEAIEKWEKALTNFHMVSKELRHRKGLYFFGVLINFISLTCLYIIPLFIAYSIHDYASLNPLTAIASSAYVLIIGAFVPIPGATGGIEYGFVRFFGNFLPVIKLNSVLLLWRFITYYLGVILGAMIFSTEKKD